MKKTKSYGYKELQELIVNKAKIYHYSIEYNKKSDILPLQGIYVMFEENQKDRIVRIGKAVDLKERLWTHFTKTVDKSVLRKHVQSALLNENKPANEAEISKYIQNNISFALIYVTKMLFVDELEKRMIRTVAEYSKDLTVNNWLGFDCDNNNVKKYRIWNSDDVEYDCPLDKAYFDLIECGLVRK